MRRKGCLGLLVAIVLAAPAAAAPGDLDPSFASDGRLAVPGIGPFVPRAVAIDAADRIVVAGYLCDGSATEAGDGTCLDGGEANVRLARLTPDGGLDPEFGDNGIVTTPMGEGRSQAFDVLIEPDGRIVTGGVARSGGRDVFALARYDDHGALDPAFGAGGIALLPAGSGYSSVGDLERGPRGTLLLAGQAVDSMGAPRVALARVTPEGALDPAFATAGVALAGGGAYGYGVALAVTPAGRLIAAGIAGDSADPATFRFGVVSATSAGAVLGATQQRVGSEASFANGLTLLDGGGYAAVGAGTQPDGHQAMAVVRASGPGHARTRLIGLGDGAVVNDIRRDPSGGAWLIGQVAHGSDYAFATVRIDAEGAPLRTTEIGWPDYPLARATAGALQSGGRLVTVGIGCAQGRTAKCLGGTPILLAARERAFTVGPAVSVPRVVTRAALRRGLKVRVRLPRPARIEVLLRDRAGIVSRRRTARRHTRIVVRLHPRRPVRGGRLRLVVRVGRRSVTRTVALRR